MNLPTSSFQHETYLMVSLFQICDGTLWYPIGIIIEFAYTPKADFVLLFDHQVVNY